jgi:hypothetical protein
MLRKEWPSEEAKDWKSKVLKLMEVKFYLDTGQSCWKGQ